MEALAIISLAGNILQFLEFSVKVFKNAKEMRDNAISANGHSLTLEACAEEFRQYSQKLMDPLVSTLSTPEAEAVQEYSLKCNAIIEEILRKLKKMKPEDPKSRRQTILAALRMAFREDELKEMAEKLQRYTTEFRHRFNDFNWFVQFPVFSCHKVKQY
jgi:hypothetical protein